MNKEKVLIFGGDGKIAQEMVKKYLNNNTTVIVIDRKEKSSNDDFNNNQNYYYYSADVTDVNQLMDIYGKIQKEFSNVNHIISAAGMPMPSEEKGIIEMDLDEIDKSIKLNLYAHIYITKIFLPLLKTCESSNKSIVLVSSINALKSFKYTLPVYSASKSGIYGFMNSIVRYVGKDKIRINTVTPGTVATKKEIEDKYYNYEYKDMMALGNFTSPEDIADATFSLTHIMKAVTGQNLLVDSGQIS